MKTILVPLLATLAGLLRNRALLHLEILALRQQLAVPTRNFVLIDSLDFSWPRAIASKG